MFLEFSLKNRFSEQDFMIPVCITKYFLSQSKNKTDIKKWLYKKKNNQELRCFMKSSKFGHTTPSTFTLLTRVQ